jgi:hypothetical protein
VANEDYPLFRKVYDASIWITGRIEQYPKSQRFLLGARTLDLCYELLSSTVESIALAPWLMAGVHGCRSGSGQAHVVHLPLRVGRKAAQGEYARRGGRPGGLEKHFSSNDCLSLHAK